ncbi:arylsulfatase-like [Lytechinus variegatus]|uniref:arylsulfatase-like n=1 Tax=Lytechinus variegatus TaxID=7654 RepID=UPI001BB2168B|nr:arylsulfatase-like [Lytechinus variegatus]
MRMTLLRSCYSAIVIISCTGCCIMADTVREPLDRPNILLFLADDMGYGDLESYGHPSQESGPIDQMAREGMKFSRWYSPDVLCSPSRGAMLTGRLPVRVGLYGPARVFEMSTSYGLPKSETTIAEMLKEQGYHTGMVGKWHQGINEFSHNDGNHLPHHHGFDFVGHLIPFTNHWMCDETKIYIDAPDRYYCLLYYNDTIIQQPLSHRNLTERLVEDAKSFIFDHQDEPFFFYFSFPQVHTDMFSSPKFSGSSKRGRYGDSLNEMSWAVGETLSAIKEAGLERNTLALFLSDHGPQTEVCNEGGSSGILKGSKDSTWEGGIRVPAIARWPDTIAQGSHSQAIISSMDIFATAADLSGGKLPQDRIMDSSSFLPILTGTSAEHRKVLFHYCSDRLMAVTYGVFKAHFYTKPAMNLEQLATKCRKGWIPTGPYHLCFSCDPPCAVHHEPPLLYNIGVDPSELSPLNTRKYLDVLSEVERIVEEHQKTLVKGDSLFIRERALWLNPCCNPPYCMCNYDRTLYLKELGLS